MKPKKGASTNECTVLARTHARTHARRTPHGFASLFTLPGCALAALIVLLGAYAHSRVRAMEQKPTLTDLVRSSAAVFVATVTDVDIAAGSGLSPRTRVSLKVEEVWAGAPPAEVSFELPEGLLHDGRFLYAVHAPKFVPGETYAIFFKAGPWTVSPVTGGSGGYLRRVTIAGRTVFVNGNGRGITAIADEGFVEGPIVAQAAAQLALDQRSGVVAQAPSAAQELLAQTCMDATALATRVRQMALATGVAGGELVTSPTIIPQR